MNSTAQEATIFNQSSTRPDIEVMRERVIGLRQTIAASSSKTESARRVLDENMIALRDIGYFNIVKPLSWGGYGYNFSALVDLNMELAKACASTAWVGGLLAAHQWLVASFPEAAQDDVWRAGPDSLVCGSYAPASKAAAVSDGFLISGHWSFTSGCDNAQWAVCGAVLPEDADASEVAGGPAFLLVPATDYVILDNWNVTGLAGTGSKTLVLDKVFVPKHRALRFSDATTGQTPGARLHADHSSLRIPMLCNIPSCLASVAVGAALGALEEYICRVGTRVTRGAVVGANHRMAEFPTIQLRVAEAAACTDVARRLLISDLQALEQAADDGREISIEKRVISRRGQAFSVRMAIRAAELLNASTGGQGLELSDPIQRVWRDTNAVGRHISMNWDAVGTMYGQMALGMAPKGQY